MAETKKKTTTTKTSTKSSNKPATKQVSKPKTETKTTTKTTTKSSSKSGLWGLNKISFYVLGAMAILYLIASILSLCGISLQIVGILQGLSTAIALCIISLLAWKYVRNKAVVWKVLYFVLLLVVLLGIILPLVV